MKVPQEQLVELIEAIQETNDPTVVDLEGREVVAYYLRDLTLSFLRAEQLSFFGLTFNVLGLEFAVLANRELIVTVLNDEGDEEGRRVDDERLAGFIGTYLAWRTNVLDALGG